MSTQPYGPNTAAVRGFLVRLAGLGASDRELVVARHLSLSQTRAYEIADASLGEAITRSGREDARDALTGPLLQLVKRPDAAEIATADDVALEPIAEPALAALLALLVSDLLNDDARRVLTEPFVGVILPTNE